MLQWLILGFYSILAAILLFRIYQTVSTECLTAIIAIILLIFCICKSISEKAVRADYEDLIETQKKNNEELRKSYKDLIETCRNNL